MRAKHLLHYGKKMFTPGGIFGLAGGVARRSGNAGLARNLRSVQRFTDKTATPLMLAGVGGMAAGVPGAEHLLNLSMGPLSAVGAYAPNVIRSSRLATGKYNNAIEQDARSGADQAGVDFLEMIHKDPSRAAKTTGYADYMEEAGLPLNGAAARYDTPYKPHSIWKRTNDALLDPQELINERIHQGVASSMNKGASSIGGIIKGVGKSILPALGLGFGAKSIYDSGKAITEDKPYDVAAVQEQGYAAAQNAINKKFQEQPAWQRKLLQLDPSLATFAMAEHSPGAVAKFKAMYGPGGYSQGLLGSVQQAWAKGGKPTYYQIDNNGRRNYVASS